MIYTERKIYIKNGNSSIDNPIILYRGDREVEILFTIIDSKFKFGSSKGNVIDTTQAAYGQLAVSLPDGTDLFTEIVECQNGVVLFNITGEMIDEINEVGFYSFHIRLYNDDKSSRITIPPVMEGIEIREPLVIESDVENTDVIGDATVGYSMIQTYGAEEEVFDEAGNYNPTTWCIGDKITAEKLNKIERFNTISNIKYPGLIGKKLSLLGDSVTTLSGYIPDGYAAYYPMFDVNVIDDTWWGKLLNETGMVLHKNCAWSGSTVTSSIVNGNAPSNGTSAAPGCSDYRINDLAKDGIAPDIIIVLIGINDFGLAKAPVGDWDGGTLPVEGVVTDFSDAYALMVSKILKTYPESEVFISTILSTTESRYDSNNTGEYPTDYMGAETVILQQYNHAIRHIAESMGVNLIDMHACGITYFNVNSYTGDGLHPNSNGTTLMMKKALAEIVSKTRYIGDRFIPVESISVSSELVGYTSVPVEIEVTVSPSNACSNIVISCEGCVVIDNTITADSAGEYPITITDTLTGVSAVSKLKCEANTFTSGWYTNFANNVTTMAGASVTYLSSFGYADQETISKLQHVPINSMRCVIAKEGSLTYGKVSSTEYTTLGTVELVGDIDSICVCNFELMMLNDDERIWIHAESDTGLIKYSRDICGGNFVHSISETNLNGIANDENDFNLGVDFGYFNSEWYFSELSYDVADTQSAPSLGGFMYASDDTVNLFRNKPINMIRCKVASEGILSYGIVSDTKYEKVGEVELVNENEIGEFEIEEITLNDGENLWFHATDDTGLFYFRGIEGDTSGGFYANVKDTDTSTYIYQTTKHLCIDIGYKK